MGGFRHELRLSFGVSFYPLCKTARDELGVRVHVARKADASELLCSCVNRLLLLAISDRGQDLNGTDVHSDESSLNISGAEGAEKRLGVLKRGLAVVV